MQLERLDGILQTLFVAGLAAGVADVPERRIDFFQLEVDFSPPSIGLLVLLVGLLQFGLGRLAVVLCFLDAVGNLVATDLELLLVADQVVLLGLRLLELLLCLGGSALGGFHLSRNLLELSTGTDTGRGSGLSDRFVFFFLVLGQCGLVFREGLLLGRVVFVLEALQIGLGLGDGGIEVLEGFFVGGGLFGVFGDLGLVVGDLFLKGFDFFLDSNQRRLELIDLGGQFDPLLVGLLVRPSRHGGLLFGFFERHRVGSLGVFLFLHLGLEFREVLFPLPAIDFHVIDLPQIKVGEEVLSVGQELIEALGFLLLFLEKTPFSLHSLLLVVGKERGGLGLFLGEKGRLEGPLQFGALRNLFQELDEFRGRFARQGFHVALKDQKVAGLDQHTNAGQFVFVLFVADHLVVEAVVAGTIRMNGTLELGGGSSHYGIGSGGELGSGSSGSGLVVSTAFVVARIRGCIAFIVAALIVAIIVAIAVTNIVVVVVLIVTAIVLEINCCARGELIVVVVPRSSLASGGGWPKDQILHLAGTQIPGLNPEDETKGVHAIALARTIGTNDAGERLEGTNLLQATIGFEVLEFEVGDRHCSSSSSSYVLA